MLEEMCVWRIKGYWRVASDEPGCRCPALLLLVVLGFEGGGGLRAADGQIGEASLRFFVA